MSVFSAKTHFTEQSSTFEMFGGNVNQDAFEFTGYGGGILITFDNAFRGLPSVIVSPIVGVGEDRKLDVTTTTDEFALPYVVVEHITETSAIVKAYWLNTVGAAENQDGAKVGAFEPISFHIVVVGPQSDPFLSLDDSFIA